MADLQESGIAPVENSVIFRHLSGVGAQASPQLRHFVRYLARMLHFRAQPRPGFGPTSLDDSLDDKER